MKRWHLVCAMVVAAGCSSTPDGVSEPARTVEIRDADIDRAIASLRDDDPVAREAAEELLLSKGLAAVVACEEALRAAKDLEQRGRLESLLARIELESGDAAMEDIWRDQWFALSKDGALVGFEHDRAFRGAYLETELSAGSLSPNLATGDVREGWKFTCTLSLSDPRVLSLVVDATCRRDRTLSPVRVTWEQRAERRRLSLEWDRAGKLCRWQDINEVTGSREFVVQHDLGRLCLAINASRIVERAALVERTHISLDLFDCDDASTGRTRSYAVRLEGRDALSWDGERIPVLKYAQAGVPEAGRDVYWVSKERGLMAARIRGYSVVRLRESPFEDAIRAK